MCLQCEKSTDTLPWSGLWVLCACLWFAVWLNDRIWCLLRNVAGTCEKQVSQKLVATCYPSAFLSLSFHQAFSSLGLSRGSQMEIWVSVSWAKSRALQVSEVSSPLPMLLVLPLLSWGSTEETNLEESEVPWPKWALSEQRGWIGRKMKLRPRKDVWKW